MACNTAYAFTVRAKDAAGNVSLASNTANATTSACSANEIVVYNEALGTDWQDWPWNTSDNLNNTSPVQVGSKSARVDYYSYGGFSLRKGAAVTTSGSTILRFWVQSRSNTQIRVYTTNTDDGGDTPGYTFTTASNQWQEISVNMSQLGNPSQIKRITFQNYSSNNATVYYDNIRLVAVSGARIAAENSEGIPDLLVYPNPSDGIVTVNYVAQQVEPVQIRVVNASGTAVQSQDEQANPGENAFKIDMRGRNAGWYLIQLQGSTNSHTRKVLIQR